MVSEYLTVVIYDGEILVLDGTGDLHDWSSSMQKLQCHFLLQSGAFLLYPLPKDHLHHSNNEQ